MGNVNVKKQSDKEIELEWTDDEVRPGDQYLYLDQEDFGDILKLAEKMGWLGEGTLLKIFKDGDQFCVLQGEDLQTGIAGFGVTIPTALLAFVKELKMKAINELSPSQIEAMKDIKNGATIFGLPDATIIRYLQKQHPDWIEIIDDIKELERIEGKKYEGTDQVPYFGAILTKEGKDTLKAAVKDSHGSS